MAAPADDPFLRAAADAALNPFALTPVPPAAAPPRPPAPAAADPFARPPEPVPGDEPPEAAAAPVARRAWTADVLRDARRGLRLLADAARTYRGQLRPLLALTAVLFLPAAFVKSCVVATVTGPVVAADLAARERAEAAAEADMIADVLAREAALKRSPVELHLRAAVGRFLTGLLYALGLGLVLAGMGLVLARGGGEEEETWQEMGARALRRAPALVPLALPAALVGAGLALLVVPGLAAAWALAFTPALALRGPWEPRRALRDSVQRALAAPGATAVLVLALFVAATLAHALGGLLSPDSGKRAAVFMALFLGDLLLVVALPAIALAWAQLGDEAPASQTGVESSRG